MRRTFQFLRFCGLIAVVLFVARASGTAQAPPGAVHRARLVERSLRLYVFDCGTLHVADVSRFNLKKEEVASTDLSVACFLIVHPKGTLVWDTGAVADDTWQPTGKDVAVHLTLPSGESRDLIVRRTLKSQLAEIGYRPSDITYLALSHYHYDHTANANEFAGATWLVRQVERDAMFADHSPATTNFATYSALRNSKTIILTTSDYDVFGDGAVMIKFAPGHTPGHQLLYVKLPKTGGVVLSGDLYHYPEERTLNRVPNFDFDPAQTRESRAALEVFLKQSGAQLWIQHDLFGNAKLKKSPSFYD